MALREALYGALAVSQRRYGVDVVAFHFMSNHYHGLFKITSATSFAKFLAHFHAGITRAWHRVCGASGKLLDYMKWVPVAPDEESVVKRIDYIMGQAVRAGIISHPSEFPGASSNDWMLEGKSLRGGVFDATAYCRDKRLHAGPAEAATYVQHLEVKVIAPPCWSELSDSELRLRYHGIARQIVQSSQRHVVSEVPAAELPPKVDVPPRRGDDGGPFFQGAVRPKVREAGPYAKGFPKLLAATAAQIVAFEAEWRSVAQAYYAAKSSWLSESIESADGLRAAAVSIPAHTLLGTMPFLAEKTDCDHRGRGKENASILHAMTKPLVAGTAAPGTEPGTRPKPSNGT